jgi:hypothetical protein
MDGELFVLGDQPRRREDVRFLSGAGAYLDDLAFPGVAHAFARRTPMPEYPRSMSRQPAQPQACSRS